MRVPAAYDPDKFKELVLFIAERSEADPKFGETKLNKLLFYADFVAYRELGRPITGARYQKLQFGPAAIPLLPVQEQMIAQGELVIRSGLIGAYRQKKPIALRQPRLSNFSGEEIALVDELISELWQFGAGQVRDLSHELPSWQVAAFKEEIPYATAFVESIQPRSQAA